MAARSIINNRGSNDATYVVQKKIGGKAWKCPIYSAWYRMISSDDPVETNWYSFMAFRQWMLKQDWEDRWLDRLLLGNGVKYSHLTCCFLEQTVWYAVLELKTVRSSGITKPHGDKIAKPWRVHCCNKHVGYYKTIAEAEAAWRRAKKDFIRTKLDNYNGRVRKALEKLTK